ncbi:MAG TPA: Stp1/IreP family PP2C-type Ser/Thr phosphatase [Candidatus Limnocylindrales bacterium]|nr:Stp1/IreP family PP2C-type Ser/Thr phosphatase [Candidatus Limnocylindrales bacterium]
MTGSNRYYLHRSSAQTSVGQVRENNEDSIRLWAHDACVLGVVADGMGGAAAGEEASGLAVQAIERGVTLPGEADEAQIIGMTDEAVARMLETAIREGNHDILELARRSPDMRGMGTTITIAYVRGSRCIVAHVGDSRAYLVEVDPPQITQITSDHSFVEALVAAGHLTPDQAAEHPMKNVLYRALGQSEYVEVDIYEVQLEPTDRLVLCSDGLTRHVDPAEIADIAQTYDNPDDIGARLIELANTRGGEDNVSVVVIEIAADPDADPESTLELRRIDPQADETLTLGNRAILDDLISSIPAADGGEAFHAAFPPPEAPDDKD